MELICLGDSLTFGYGVKTSAKWTNIVAANTGWKITNLGITGDTTSGMLVRLNTQILNRPEFAGYHPDRPTVFVMGGGNDLFYSGTDITARANIGAIIHQLRACGSEPIIGIPMTSDFGNLDLNRLSFMVNPKTIEQQFDDYHNWLINFCKEFRVRYIDFSQDFLTEDSKINTSLFLGDYMHPNEKGHELIAQRLSAYIKDNL